MPNIIKIYWEYEDNLPDDLSDAEYDAMFLLSKVDIVRMFPYIIVKGKKLFLSERILLRK